MTICTVAYTSPAGMFDAIAHRTIVTYIQDPPAENEGDVGETCQCQLWPCRPVT